MPAAIKPPSIHPTHPRGFVDYRNAHPDAFRHGTLDRQIAYYVNQILPAENERAMTAQILDRAAEENSRNQTGNRTQHKPADTEETGNPEEDEWTCPASFDTPEIRAEARRVYESGRFLDYCRDTFSKVWYGDFHILEAILYQSAAARMGNPEDGIHLHIAGPTQSGKSDSVKAALDFIHPDDKLNKKFSKAWIYYAKELHERTILFSDDTAFSPEEAEFFRSILTSWKTGCDRGTVKNQEAINQHIPARISMILTSVDAVSIASDDGQDESRFLTVNVRRDPETDAAIRKFVQHEKPDISHEIRVIRSVWDMIEPGTNVTRHKEFSNNLPFREFKRYLTLVKCRALLSGRKTTDEKDVIEVDKFLSYSTPMIDSTTAGLTRNERAVSEAITDKWTTIAEIQDKTKLPYHTIVRSIRGTRGTIDNPTNGLLVKLRDLQTTTERSDTQNNIRVFRRVMSSK